MKRLIPLLVLFLACNQRVYNPVDKDHPCGTRAHVCYASPLTCCWNSEACGSVLTPSCPADMCCYVGDDTGYAASPTALKPTGRQWSPK